MCCVVAAVVGGGAREAGHLPARSATPHHADTRNTSPHVDPEC